MSDAAAVLRSENKLEFQLTYNDISSPTTARVRERLAQGKGSLVVGRPGTGKSYAVRNAVNGAKWIDLREDERQFDFFFTELAAQLPNGQRIVDALAARDATTVFKEAEIALRDDTLVIDRGERLQLQETWGWDDPVEALWRPDQARLARWINQCIDTRPFVVIARGRRDFYPERERIQHFCPDPWPLKLNESKGGWRNWPALGHALRGLPAGLWVGALLLELMHKDEFNELVLSLDLSDDTNEESGGGLQPTEVLRELLGVLKQRMPDDWRRVLATVHTLDGAPAEVIERVLPGDVATLRYLEELGAITRRGGRLSMMSALILNGPIAELLPRERRSILTQAAQELLERVPHLETPHAMSAEWIVRAHALYVEIGDFEAAYRTAKFHLGGLVRLARFTSLDGRWSEARRIYGIIEPLTSREPRVTSYAVHYQHMNGHWAGEIPRNRVLEGLERARELWPENALWWQREAEILLELGRNHDAIRTVERAYDAVADHPRRNLFLRVRPASHAMRQMGTQITALRIIEPLDAAATDVDAEVRAGVNEIFDRWRSGVELPELGCNPTGRLVFHEPVVVSLERLGDSDFRAECRSLSRAGRADAALAAINKLAQTVGDELRALVETRSTRLDPAEVLRKGVLIGYVDVLNSDIGLARPAERWILGRFEGRHFVPVLSALSAEPPMELDPNIELPPVDANTLYFVKFPVHRDGWPSGSPSSWELAGSGRSPEELWKLLRSMGDHSDG